MVAGKLIEVKPTKKRGRGRPKKSKPKKVEDVVLKPTKKIKPKRFMSKEDYDCRMNYLRKKLTNTLAFEEQEKYLKMVNKLKNDVIVI